MRKQLLRKYNKRFAVKAGPFFVAIIAFIVLELTVGNADDFLSGVLRLITCVIFAYCIYRGSQEEFFLNPFFLFCVTPLSLLMYNHEFSVYYLRKLLPETWTLAIINMIAFLFLLTRTSSKHRISEKRNEGDAKFHKRIDIHRQVIHAILLSVIGVTPSIATIAGISFPLRMVLRFFSFIGISFAMKTKKVGVIIITLAMALVPLTLDFNKTELLFLAMTVAACFEAYYIHNRREKALYLFLIVLVGVFMIVIAFPLKAYTREGGSISSFLQNSSSISASAFAWFDGRFSDKVPGFLQMPYMYLIQAWNNVQFVLETQNSRTYGLWMIKPLLAYLQIDGFFEEYYTLIPASTFNTFTYITVLFKDFGYYLSMIGSGFLGFYVKKIYSGFRKNGSAFNTASYGLVAMATLEMFFSNHFFSLSYPFTIVIVGFLYKKLFKLEGY